MNPYTISNPGVLLLMNTTICELVGFARCPQTLHFFSTMARPHKPISELQHPMHVPYVDPSSNIFPQKVHMNDMYKMD